MAEKGVGTAGMTCVIHIGTEKTATTTIQDWLQANRPALSRLGIGLPSTIGVPNNRDLVAYFQNVMDDYFYCRRITTAAEKADHFAGFLDRFEADIAELGRTHKTVVISSEHLHSRIATKGEIEAIKSYLSLFFARFRIVCYVREQSEVRRSLYSTAVRSGWATELADFDVEGGKPDHYYDFLGTVQKWSDVFGRDSIVCRPFNRSTFPSGDICRDFISASIPDADSSILEFNTAKANETLSYLQARALRSLNEHWPLFDRDWGFDKTWDFKSHHPSRHEIAKALELSEVLRVGRIEDPRQVEFHARFEADNRRLFAEFMPNMTSFPVPSAVRSLNCDDETLSLREVGDLIDKVVAEIASAVQRSVHDPDLQNMPAPPGRLQKVAGAVSSALRLPFYKRNK